MARPKIKARKGQHGDAISGNPGQPNIKVIGTGGGGGAGGPKSVRGPGVNASVKGKVAGMSGGK